MMMRSHTSYNRCVPLVDGRMGFLETVLPLWPCQWRVSEIAKAPFVFEVFCVLSEFDVQIALALAVVSIYSNPERMKI